MSKEQNTSGIVHRRFSPYPQYKDSGVKWLGKIPAGWDARRLKFLLAEPLKYGANETAELDEPDLPRYVRITDIDEKDGLREETFKSLPADVAEEYLLREGDLLFARSGATAGKTFLYRRSWGTCAYAGYLIRARLDKSRVFPEFARYFTAASSYWHWLSAVFIQSTIQNVSAERYASLVMPQPSYPEQRTISSYLDRETAKIDALIEKKERLIELLQEKRSALITQAVTKGLDPTVPMKDSGVEWLGKIPAGWVVMKTTWIFSIGSGTTPGSEDPTYYGGETPWLTTSELRESVVTSTNKNVTVEALRDFSSLKVYPPGSVVVAMYGATIGRLGILGIPATVNQACCVFSNPRNIDKSYWYYWLQMRRSYLISLGYGGGQPNLSQDLLRTIRVPTPPYPEQLSIVAFLDRETAKIDALIAKVRDAGASLKEYRTALISAAVTGKIDVRAAS